VVLGRGQALAGVDFGVAGTTPGNTGVPAGTPTSDISPLRHRRVVLSADRANAGAVGASRNAHVLSVARGAVASTRRPGLLNASTGRDREALTEEFDGAGDLARTANSGGPTRSTDPDWRIALVSGGALDAGTSLGTTQLWGPCHPGTFGQDPASSVGVIRAEADRGNEHRPSALAGRDRNVFTAGLLSVTADRPSDESGGCRLTTAGWDPWRVDVLGRPLSPDPAHSSR
jgi:hypothetical protein